MNSLAQDLRFALRTYARNPGLTLTLLLILALGIGGATAMFSVLNGVVLRPLPYSQPNRIVLLPGAGFGEIETWAQAPSITHLAIYGAGGINLTGDTQAERLQAAAITHGFFPVFEVAPQLGRPFGKGDEAPGQHHVVLLSEGLWRRNFGRDPRAVGAVLHLNGIPHTIVGVMPTGFAFPGQTELWVPAEEPYHVSRVLGTPDQPELPDFLGQEMVARLRDGATIQQASAELEVLRQQLKQKYAGTNRGVGSFVGARSLQRMLVWEVRPALLLLFVAIVLVLLIACANTASLLLARASGRQKEIAVRLCMGASRLRVARQFLTEGILLALLGGFLGTLLAYWGVDLIRALSPSKVPRISEARVDLAALGFALGISLLVGVLVGLAPAFAAARQNLTETLKQEGQRSTGGIRQRARSVFVVTEVALAVMLLTGATLVIQSFFRLINVSPGIETQNIITMALGIPPNYLRSTPEAHAFYQRLLEDSAAFPGVIAVGGSVRLPLGAPGGHYSLDLGNRQYLMAQTNFALGDYFRVFSIPVLHGRSFTQGDHSGAPRVVIVNQTLARRLAPEGTPVGLPLQFEGEAVPRQIVGVVGNVKQGGLEEEELPQAYLPYFQAYRDSVPAWDPVIVVRTAAQPKNLVPAIRAKLQAIDKDLVVFRLKTMEQVVAQSTAPLRFRAQLMGTFGALAVLLAILGVYGLVSYSVAARTHEIGVRMALGAERANIVRMVLIQGARLVLTGAVLGVGAAWGLGRFLSRLLFGISPTDPATLAVSAVALVLVALAACLIPALRASRVEPATALRYE